MDERLHEFPSLFELDLSSNNLDTIENVPDAVQLLNAFSNKITELAVASQPPQPSLLHLGLGFNRVRDVTSHLPAAYPNLISLDLSYNCIIDISPLMLVLARCEHLRQLLLVGNPVCFLKQYRPLVISALGEKLERLDDIEVEESERMLSPEIQEKASRVMEQWASELFSDKMDVFARKRRRGQGDDAAEDLIETVARRIQNAYRSHKAIKAAQHKKMLMEQCKNDRAISMTVSIESMRYLSLKLSKTDEAAATDEKGKSKDKKKGKDDKKKDDKKKDDKKKGKDDKKKGKDKGKPDDDKKEDEDEDEEGGKPFLKRGIRLAFTLPGEVVSKDAKEASHTSKPYARKALVRYDYAKLVKLPISVALRDFFKFDGLVIDAFEDVNSPPKKKRDAGDGAEADAGEGDGEAVKKPEQRTFHLGSGMLRMGEFLEPALFRATAGAPTLSRELKLHLVRSEEAREDDAKLPAEEDIVVQVKIALNDEVYGQFAVAAEDAPPDS